MENNCQEPLGIQYAHLAGEALLRVHESQAHLTTNEIALDIAGESSMEVSHNVVAWMFDKQLLLESSNEERQTEFGAEGIALLENAFIYGPEEGFEPADILTNYVRRHAPELFA